MFQYVKNLMQNQNIITQDVRMCYLVSFLIKLNRIFKTKLIRIYKHSKIKQCSVFKTRKSSRPDKTMLGQETHAISFSVASK